VIVSILEEVAGAATETRRSAQTALSDSESVETATAKLRTGVENFVSKVAV
jgi:methyl-accepting chemotaxis protein